MGPTSAEENENRWCPISREFFAREVGILDSANSKGRPGALASSGRHVRPRCPTAPNSAPKARIGVQRLWQSPPPTFHNQSINLREAPMRPATFFLVVFAAIGISAAQDTSFSTGPQYLASSVTSGSTMFLHPITTPSLSLGEALPPVPGASSTPLSITPEPAPRIAPPSHDLFLGDVLWGEHSATEILDPQITTPTLSLSELPATANTQPSETSAPVNEIQLSSSQPSRPLPVSIVDVGVTGTAAQSLRAQDYGAPLGDVASYWKTHKPTSPHSFTNADLSRFHAN